MIADTLDPVTFGAIVVALAGFVAVMIRWLMVRQDTMTQQQEKLHEEARKEALTREERWQKREDDRDEFHKTTVLTLQSIANNLTKLDERVVTLPERVAEKLDCRRTRP